MDGTVSGGRGWVPIVTPFSRYAYVPSALATDADWTIGTGPEIAGTISAILLLLTGRTEAATPLLTGDGVRSLATT